MNRRLSGCLKPVLALLMGWGVAASAHAWDITGTVASSDKDGVRSAGVILGKYHSRPLWQGQTWRWDLHHEIELAYWRVPHARDIVEAGYTPVFRASRPIGGNQARYFAELGVGARVISHTYLTDTKTMSTGYQFSDMVGTGVQWGPEQRHTVGVRIQHLSNAGIKSPNPGINFAQGYYQYRFQ